MPNKNADYSITLNARVDTSQAQRDIDAFTRNDNGNKARKIVLKTDVDLSEVSDKLNHAIEKGYTNKINDSFQKISTNVTRNLQGIINGQAFDGLTKVVERFKNDLGEIKERVTVFREGAIKPVAHSLQTVKEGVEEISTTTKTEIKEIDNVTTKVTTLTETIKTTGDETKTVVKETMEWIDAENNLHQQIKTTDENGKLLSATTKNITNDTKKATKLMNEFADSLKKIQTPKTQKTSTLTYVDKNGVKTVKQMVDGIVTLTTRTREYTTAQGALVKETKTLNNITGDTKTHTEVIKNKQEEIEKSKQLEEQLRKEREERVKAQQQIDNGLISTTKSQSTGKTIQFGDKSGIQYDALITKIERVDAANKKAIETTYEFTNAQGQLVKQTRITDETGRKLAQDTIEISDAQKKVIDSTNKYNTSTQKASKETKSFGQALSDAMGRLVRYYIASLPIQAVRKAISEATTTLKEFDNALIEFRKVSDLADESLTKYVAKLAEMGELTGSTMQAMVEASTEFRKSGFSDEDSAKLASVAEMYRNVADEEISAADSASFIIAQMKAFNIEADDSMHIIDAVNEVANHFAVSSADLANNLGKVSAALSVNGVSFEQTLGMMTAITEVTRNASTASRGLSMISSRLVQVLDSSSSTGKKLTKIYNDLGIAIKDENGQMRGTYDILKDLADKWNTLSGDQQKYIALTSAGARQTQNFVALMKNFSQAVEATKMAYDSAGSAAKENEKVMDSIAKKTEVLKSEFQQLVIGEGGLQDFAKTILDVGINILKVVNSLGGLKSILPPIITLFITLNSLKIAQWFTTIFDSIQNLIYILPRAISAWQLYLGKVEGVAAGVVSANTAMQASVPIIGLIATALSVAVSALQNYINKLEEEKKARLDSILSYKEEQENLDAVIEKLNDESISRQELDTILEENLGAYDAEYLKILDINEAREKGIKLLKEEQERRRENLINLGQTEYEEALERLNSKGSSVPTPWLDAWKNVDVKGILLGDKEGSLKKEIWKEAGLSSSQGLTEQIKALNDYKAKLLETRSTIQGMGDLEEWYTHKIELTENAIEELKEQRDTDIATIRNYNAALSEQGKFYDTNTKRILELSEEGKRRAQLAQEQNEQTEIEIVKLEELAKQYEITTDEIISYQEAHEDASYEDAVYALIEEKEAAQELETEIETLNEEYENLTANSSTVVSSISKVNSAFKEQAENGSLAVSTQLELIDSGYGAALMYDKETGACTLNEKAVQALVEAKLQLQIQNLQNLRTSLVSTLLAEANAATVAAGSFLELAKAKRVASEAYVTRGGADPSKSYAGYGGNFGYLTVESKQTTEQIKSLDAQIKALESTLGSVKTSGVKAFGDIGKSAGGAKGKTDDLKDSLNDLKSQYDKVISYITSKIDDHIKSIQKEKDAAIKAVEAQIKAKEKQKDKELDNIEAQIKALEKEKKAREKYWDDQIDALKEANQEKKDALELQEKLDALEKAKNTKVKVYKEGQGFVYDVDQTAVAEAQKALDEYLSEKAYEEELERLNKLKDAEVDNYDKRIDALNEYKDKVQESYEKQIASLEAHRQALEEQYDAQIEYYNNFKDNFEKMVNAYEDSQTALLAKQLTGIDFEKDNWMTRLGNLAEFVNKYNALQKQIGTGTTNATGTANMSSGGGGVYGNGKSTVTNQDTPNKQYTPDYNTKKTVTNKNSPIQYTPSYKTHASGIGSIQQDEIAVVGENPNKEIVIGSKINNGSLMSLGKGTGVVNAQSSNTLAGMLNQVGKFGSSGFGSGNGTLNNNINNDSLVVNGVTIQGANISDPQTFVNGLLNLKAEALQRAYRHR